MSTNRNHKIRRSQLMQPSLTVAEIAEKHNVTSFVARRALSTPEHKRKCEYLKKVRDSALDILHSHFKGGQLADAILALSTLGTKRNCIDMCLRRLGRIHAKRKTKAKVSAPHLKPCLQPPVYLEERCD